MRSRHARFGFVLFGVYLLLYVGFVLLTAFGGAAMEAMPVRGINVALLYGFGLIVVAIVLALAYGFAGRDAAGGDDG